ncbi:DUF485 domain-containing protein [Streptomyces xiamenensis]|uniref:Integral membrane protein n=1 Tax=Streptomyces xiamenensis TaxID=408015 RepID=A0A0F7FUJ3_9ACTN|nr:DUF485 domain-containing protein [Streptomyces xiamenensis]AKG43484.1 protein of unknown function DUF485 [Streptomyces xiamenensis]
MTTTQPVPDAGEPPGDDLETRSAAMHDDPRFQELRGRLLRFVVPASLAFFTWYLLYVLMTGYARGVMSTKVIGSLNVALVFALLQFVMTFTIAVLYSRYANRRLDPLADELRAELDGEGRS